MDYFFSLPSFEGMRTIDCNNLSFRKTIYIKKQICGEERNR